MDRFCPACGAQRADGSSFCSQCGNRFEPVAPVAEAPVAPAPVAAAPPEPEAPAAAAPPPLTAAPLQAGQATIAAPPPAPARGMTPGVRALVVVAALLSIGFGVWKILDAFHVFGGRHSSYSSTYSGSSSLSPPTAGVIDDYWLQGTWTSESGVRCATWVRFNADHTLIDESGGTGTWQLRTWGTTTGDLTMTLAGRAPVHGNASRLGQDLAALGNRNYRRASC